MYNNVLIEALEREIIFFKDDILNTERGRMLVSEYEKELKRMGWDANTKIKITARGEYKVSTPIQVCLKNRTAVLKRIYDYYFDPMSYTLDQCFKMAMERFDKLVVGDARSTETASNYRTNWTRFFGDFPIAQRQIRNLKASDIHEHLEKLSMLKICRDEQTMSVSTMRDAKTLLQKAFAWAYNNDIITHNLMNGLSTTDILLREINNDDRIYSESDRDKLLAVMTNEKILSSYRKGSLARVAARALCLAFCSIIRCGEIRSLKWNDVDWTIGNESISIHSQIRRFHDESGKQRYLYSAKTKAKKAKGNRKPSLCDFAVEILEAQRQESSEDAVYIFESKGKPLAENALNQWLKRFCNHAGVEYLPSHCIRFYAVTALDNAGIEKGKIQHAAGHCCASTTDHYIRHAKSDELTKEEVNRVYKAPTKPYQNEGKKKNAKIVEFSAFSKIKCSRSDKT